MKTHSSPFSMTKTYLNVRMRRLKESRRGTHQQNAATPLPSSRPSPSWRAPPKPRTKLMAMPKARAISHWRRMSRSRACRRLRVRVDPPYTLVMKVLMKICLINCTTLSLAFTILLRRIISNWGETCAKFYLLAI